MGVDPGDGPLGRPGEARSLSLIDKSAAVPSSQAPPWLAATAAPVLGRTGRPVVLTGKFPLALTVALFALAFLLPAWPWLSGRVTIPWDAKSQFLPSLQFLATSLANGQSPFWTPNVFAGWPLISDPQSLIFSPLHFLFACFDPKPGFRAIDGLTFVHLFLGGVAIILYFRDRGWHAAGALVAALAFAFGGSANSRLQHTGQIISLAYLALTLWMLSRALERSSWRAGLAAGMFGGLLAVGRDQVALISLYVLVGFVAYHWIESDDWRERMHASLRPLAACCLAGILVVAVPVTLTALFAERSNRPEIDWMIAGEGSLHPAHLLTLAFADLYGAMDPAIDYWGPATSSWKATMGGASISLAQNMGLVYAGSLLLVVIISFGIVRRLAWSRDIRFFSISTGVVLLYALGWYTPAFHAMYEWLPGVMLYRRPADATFVIGALLAIIAGYLVHRWLEGTVPQPSRVQRIIELAIPVVLVAAAFWLARTVVSVALVTVPVVTALAFAGGAIAALVLARRLNGLSPLAGILLLTSFSAADLAWNNAPHLSTGMAPWRFDALHDGTSNATLAHLRSELAVASAPDRRDRIELIGIGYHWPNLCMVHGCDHVFGHNPLRLKWFYDATRVGDTVVDYDQRRFSPLFPSYRSVFADLFGLRYIAIGVPVEKVDPSLAPGDLTLVARTPDAYVYENPGALPRVMVVTDWRIADFNQLLANGWPADVDPRRTVLLKRAPAVTRTSAAGAAAGTARLVHYENTKIEVDVDAPSGGLLLLNDVWHPWWRATVDGKPRDIMKANAIFRAVALRPGHHRVSFTFHPFAGAFAEIVDKFRHPH
ncbi:YfhO family protein [Bradyrhizobium sp. LHD-71]|uniref:YfhO family protein n=1 Tax=Bradyrhizobium sp. LHD-71 TaxID=3072141 RepID=UPI0028100C47|nr:YfhO family protein [Bradyrhizobium sp. LHD-71]MDQ8732030.1 YfhO family protein [Bradyrhizobium sp. LHD-71]